MNYCQTLRRVFRRLFNVTAAAANAPLDIEQVGVHWTLSCCQNASPQHTIDLIKPRILLLDDRNDWVAQPDSEAATASFRWLNRRFPGRQSIRRASLVNQLLNYKRREFRGEFCAGGRHLTKSYNADCNSG